MVVKPKAGSWNRCPIRAASVTAGSYYWLALLQPVGSTGRLQYREGQVSGAPTTFLLKTSGLAATPPAWQNGFGWTGGYQASVYADLTTDTTPPDTTITAGPSGTVTSDSASVSFTGSETGSTFECRIDSGVFAGRASPKSYSGLANGSHTFNVRATDAAGNTDASPAARTWSVDVSSPGACAVSTPNVPDGPDRWGGCFPGPSNTGMPAGTRSPLTPARARSRRRTR